MKKVICFSAVFIGLLSCNNSTDEEKNTQDTVNTALDSTIKHPDGVTSGSVISTDTAAMRVRDTIKK